MSLDTGSTIDGTYSLNAKLSEGGGGVVWLATDPEEREVALKTLKWSPLKSKETATERFKNEFAIFKELAHPNIARIYDFGFDREHDVYYFTSELLTGGDLRQFLSRPMEDIEPLLLKALRSLEYLRNRGLVHLDIKPQNFLIREGTGDPELVLIDFGLATFRPPDTPGGTANYMPPEIVARRMSEEWSGIDFPPPDHRSDLYSLGVTFYYILTGVQPFKVIHEDTGRLDLSATLMKHLELTEPPPPSHHRADIPNYIDTIIMKLMGYHPDDRYPAAALATQALRYRSPRNLEPEDTESLLSYLPKQGRMVDRRDEIATAEATLTAVAEKKAHAVPVLFIAGGRGSGRTRFLEMLKPLSQRLEMETHLINALMAHAEETEVLSSTESASDRPQAILIDDFDQLLSGSSSQSNGVAFLNALRAYLDRARRFQRLTHPTSPQPFIALTINTDVIDIDAAKEKLGVDDASSTTVTLNNFTPNEIGDYLTSMLGEAPSEDAIETLHRITEGNPLFITEQLERMIAEGGLFSFAGRPDATTLAAMGIDFSHLPPPQSLKDATIARFQALSPPAQELAALMACWSDPVTLEELHQTSTVTGVESHLIALISSDIIHRIPNDDGHYTFNNPVTAPIISDHLSRKARAKHHSHIADYLERFKPYEKNRIDLHRAHSSHKSRRLRALERLAKEAEDKHHPHEATEYLEELLEEIPRSAWDMRADALIRLGRAYEWAYMPKHSLDTFKRLMKLRAPGERQRQFKIRALEQMALAAIRRRELTTAREHIAKALEHVDDEAGDMGWRLRLMNFSAGIDLRDGKADDAIKTFEATAKRAKELPPDEREKLTNNELGEALLQAGRIQEAQKILAKELEEAQRADNPDRICSRYYLLGNVMCAAPFAKYEAAMHYYEHAFAIAKERRLLRLQVRIYNSMGNCKLDTGHIDDAIDFYRKGLALSEQIDSKTTIVELMVGLGLACARKKDLDASIEYFESALDFSSGPMGTSAGILRRFEPTIFVHLGDAFYHKRDFDRAVAYLEQARDLDEQETLGDDIRYSIYGTYADVYVERGEVENARKFLPTLEDIVQRFPAARDHLAQLEKKIG